MRGQPIATRSVLGHRVDAIDTEEAIESIIERALTHSPGAYVCLSNAHTTLLSRDLPAYRAAVAKAFLSLPDGWPLAAILRRRGDPATEKVSGPNLLPLVTARGVGFGLRHFMYGWTEELARAAADGLIQRVPGAQIVGVGAPPFASEMKWDSDSGLAPAWVDIGGSVRDVDWRLPSLLDALRATRPHIIWVGLGAPVQEEFMAMTAAQLGVPLMVGVGRTFNYLAGTAPQAPAIVDRIHLEWLFILSSEPRRLWKRYLIGIPRFTYLLSADAFARRVKIRSSLPAD